MNNHYLCLNEKELNSLPLGIPFIRGSNKDYDSYVKLLEFEILLQSALASGLPFKWEDILRREGYHGKKLATINMSQALDIDQ